MQARADHTFLLDEKSMQKNQAMVLNSLEIVD
jgi:hypothetical protein